MLKLGDLVDGKGWVSSFKFQVSGFKFQVSGFKFQVAGGGLKIVNKLLDLIVIDIDRFDFNCILVNKSVIVL